ncbi:MAG: squalene/phytoene synthase family protein [Rhodospirillales bacterium]|nr:squalene/phytoene synthase family protein [Rhodospirillales bacterium]
MRPRSDPDFSLMPTLFAPDQRAAVRAFGHYVRLAEDIADNPALARVQKLERLEALERRLDDEAAACWSKEAHAAADSLRRALAGHAVSSQHPHHLLQAFRRDVEGHACATWRDLMAYCQFSAAPIGRLMLELVGEDISRCAAKADALCAALRILKQLRDCEDRSVAFNRLCIPRQFLDDAMITPAHLRAPSAKGQTRAVLDRVLDGVESLLAEAAPLPRLLRDRGMAIHTAIVLCRARRLVRRFRHHDPLRERVGLAGWQRLICHWIGTVRGIVRW